MGAKANATSDTPFDLEELMRSVLSGVSVAAYARGIGVYCHVDNRLPTQVRGDRAALERFLRQGLRRTIGAPTTHQITFAFWRGDAGEAPVMLEAMRQLKPESTPVSSMAGLWLLPDSKGGGSAETLLVPLPVAPVTGAPDVGARWGRAFRGLKLLVASSPGIETRRRAASLAHLGLEVIHATSAAEARAALAGRPDLAALDADLLGRETGAIARELRRGRAAGEVGIVLIGDDPEANLEEGEKALFDRVLRPPMPWRHIIDALYVVASKGHPGSAPARSAIWSGRIPDFSGKRVLVAEDVATNQLVLRAMLAPTGAGVEVVADGRALLERHGAEPADLILMDLQMPGMGGIEAIRRIRALAGGLGAVPAIALTAYARPADRESALAAGMNAYLAKPVNVGELYALTAQLLGVPAET